MKHILVLQKNDGNIEIFESNFERQIGDVLTINNVKMTVKFLLPNQEAKAFFIREYNKMMGRVKYQEQKSRRADEAAFWANLVRNNPIIRECMETLAMAKRMGE